MDLADQIDEYICNFEGLGDITMDTLAIYVFLWAVLALFLLWFCKLLYKKYTKKENNSKIVTSGKIDINNDILRHSEPREISASKEIKENSSKLFGSRSSQRSLGKTSGGGYIPPTPPTRKRLSRRSPGPELRKSKIVAPPSNVVGPETTSVTWTSQLFRWLYSDLVIVNELLNSWVQSLNEFTKSAAEDQGLSVEIVRVLPDSPPPSLANIFCDSTEAEPNKMIISCDCDAMPVLQVKAIKQKSGKNEISHYKVTISRFRARLAADMNYTTLKGQMKVEGYPDIRIAMNSVGAIKPMDSDEQQLQDIISETITSALRDTIYPIDFSIYSTCPRALEMKHPDEIVNYLYNTSVYNQGVNNMENSNISQNHMSMSSSQSVSSSKRMLVKIVKGEGLTKAQDPYCVVEMDEPPQKNQTGARQGINPYWDEHFLFDLSSQSAEILFEVYDRPLNSNDPPKFLGLGLVGIDELSVGPASSQVLALQPRPYETESVNGAIIVEFVFIEGAEIPDGPRPYKLKEALKISTPIINEHLKNGSNLADAAIKALEDGKLNSNGSACKSTLIIHSVQRNDRSQFKVELNKDGKIQMAENTEVDNSLSMDMSPSSPDDETFKTAVSIELDDDSVSKPPIESLDIETLGQPIAQSSPSNPIQTNGHTTSLNQVNGINQDQNGLLDPNKNSQFDDRGRSRKKKDFFGTLKRRLGKSMTRTKSADREMIPIDLDNNINNDQTRSVSADRGVLTNSTSPGRRLVVPTLDQSRRSSLSESSAISGFSTASTKTFLHEASTLVLETIENGIKRHYFVPLSLALKRGWRRKGTKLHIYNDHTFIAKHLSGGGLVCGICTKSIPRRPGKQGYECRDCQLVCHKQCHVRAPQSCSNPTVLSIELSKLNTTRADRSIRKL